MSHSVGTCQEPGCTGWSVEIDVRRGMAVCMEHVDGPERFQHLNPVTPARAVVAAEPIAVIQAARVR